MGKDYMTPQLKLKNLTIHSVIAMWLLIFASSGFAQKAQVEIHVPPADLIEWIWSFGERPMKGSIKLSELTDEFILNQPYMLMAKEKGVGFLGAEARPQIRATQASADSVCRSLIGPNLQGEILSTVQQTPNRLGFGTVLFNESNKRWEYLSSPYSDAQTGQATWPEIILALRCLPQSR